MGQSAVILRYAEMSILVTSWNEMFQFPQFLKFVRDLLCPLHSQKDNLCNFQPEAEMANSRQKYKSKPCVVVTKDGVNQGDGSTGRLLNFQKCLNSQL